MERLGCAFCELSPEDLRVIYYDNLIVSFLPDPRIMPGHSLVIPKRHLTDPSALSDHELIGINREMDRITTLLMGSMAIGMDRWQKFRPTVPEGSGTKMDHIHFHLIPSNPGDEVYDQALRWAGSAHQPLPDEERDYYVSFLRL